MRARRFGTLIGLFVLCAVLWALTPHFLTVSNLLNIAQQTSINALVAVGMTFVILSGGIDLSVGSIVALSGVVLGTLLHDGQPLAVATLAALTVGTACGLLNGALVSWGGLPPFIVTLGTMSIARGAALLFTEGRPVSGFGEGFRALATGSVGFVPAPVVVMIVVYIVAHLVLTRTTFGRYVYAIGGNEEATRLSGVHVKRHKTLIYGVSGLTSAIAAIILTARLNSAQPIAGMMYELDAIAATVIGGTSLMGGEGSLGGTLVGALIMGVLRNGLNLLGVSSFLQQIVIGAVIVGAVLVDTVLKTKSSVAGRGKPPATRDAETQRRLLGVTMRKLTLFLIAVLALSAVSCNRGGTTAGGGAEKPTVALVLKTLNHPFFVDMRRGAQEAADRLGVNLQVQAAEREVDVEKQMQIVENMIQTGIKVLLITPSGSREIVSALVKARDAKVPIVIVDTRVDTKAAGDAGVRTETFIGSDNYEGGKLAGEYAVKATGGKARVGILEGIPGHETADSRNRGFNDAIKGHPGITVAASQPANWERDQGFNVFQNMLQAHADIDTVFAASDLMALGAIEAIAAAGKTGTIRVIGFDALDDAKKAIAAGTMEASVAQFPYEMGKAAVESAVKVMNGEKLPADIMVRLEMVTKANVK